MKLKKSQIASKTCHELNILTVRQVINLELQKFGYKYENEILPKRIIEVINDDQHHKSLKKNHKYNTRNKRVPNKPKARSNQYLNSFLCSWQNEYVTLPVETKTLPNIKSFAKDCKKIMLNKP